MQNHKSKTTPNHHILLAPQANNLTITFQSQSLYKFAGKCTPKQKLNGQKNSVMLGKKKQKQIVWRLVASLTKRVNLSSIAMNPNNILKRNCRIPRDTVPGLSSTGVEVIQAMKVMILNMPSEPAKEHSNIDHR